MASPSRAGSGEGEKFGVILAESRLSDTTRIWMMHSMSNVEILPPPLYLVHTNHQRRFELPSREKKIQ